MTKTSRGFAPILIVVILGAISVVGYLILKPLLTPSPPPSYTTPPIHTPTPTPDLTTNWETYTNQRFSYSIRYPRDFTINSLEQPKGKEDIVQFKKSENGRGVEFFVSVSGDEFSKELYLTYKASYEQLIQNNEPLSTEMNNVSAEYNKMLIEGYQAYQLTLSSEASIVSNVLFEKDGLIFTFQLISDGPYDIEVFEQALSTFQFLEQ